MSANHRIRTRSGGGNFVNVQRRGVAGQDRSRLAHAIKLGRYFLFERHAFKYSFNHHVHAAEVLIVEGWRDQLEAFINILLGKASALNRIGIILFDGCQTTVQCCLISLFEQDWNSGIGKYHGNAATHGSRADYSHALYRNRRCFFGHVGNLGHLAFAKEDVNQCFGLV